MESQVFHDELSRIARAIGHPLRARVLDVLTQGERTVDALQQRLDVQLSTLSSQLKVLRDARLVCTRRDGTRIYYSIADPSVLQALLALRGVAERRSEGVRRAVDEFSVRVGQFEAVHMEEISERLRDGSAVLIDVRPREEYDQGHIPGAVSVPLEELERHLEAIPAGQPVVAYCRDQYCVLAPEAARRLRALGRDGGLLDAGFTEWAAAERPVEREGGQAS